MISSQPCVLIVDTEPALLDLISRTLRNEGVRVMATTTQEVIKLCEEETADLIVCNLRPPYPLCDDLRRQIRQCTRAPILVLAPSNLLAADSDSYDLEPIDYLTLPFHAEELVARVDAALRRRRLQRPEAVVLRFGRLEVDLAGKRVLRDRQAVRLSRIECALLEELIRYRGTILTHSMLLRRVWGDAYADETTYVHVYISRLRRKLEDDPSTPRYFITKAGIGYRFESPAQQPVLPSDTPIAIAPPAPPATAVANLPVPRTSLLGREQEIVHANCCGR